MVLEQRLEALFERVHIVLVFLQFVAMLDVIEVSVPTLIRDIFSWTMGMTGLSAQVQTLVIMPHRRFDGPIGTLCGDGPFPTRRRQVVICMARLKARKPGQPSPDEGFGRPKARLEDPASPSRAHKAGLSALMEWNASWH